MTHTPSPSARRVWPLAAESRKLASEVSVCEPRVSFSLPLRLCVWAVVLPFGLALSLLWGTRRPPARRLRRLRRAVNRRLRPRVLVPVPPLWRPLPSSCRGPASGPSSQPVTAPASTDCGAVWDGEPCDPYLHDLIERENRRFGPHTASSAASSPASGGESRESTGVSSFTPSWSTWRLGDHASVTSGQPHRYGTVSCAFPASPVGDRTQSDPAELASGSCKKPPAGRAAGTSTAPAAGRTSSTGTRSGSCADGRHG